MSVPPTGAHSVGSAATSSSGAPPMLMRSNSLVKKCCVVGCNSKRDKEGYCMPHFLIFKQHVSSADEAARARDLEKQLATMSKEKDRIMKEVAAERQRASAAMSGAVSSKTLPSSRGSGSVGSKSWWRRSATMGGRSGCLSGDRNDPSQSLLIPRPAMEESPLLIESRRAWSSAHAVLFKDLPRLAKRISVQTEAVGTLIEAGRIIKTAPPMRAYVHTAGTAAVPASSPTGASLTSPSSRRSLSIGSWESWKGIENESWASAENIRRRNRELDAQHEQRRLIAAGVAVADFTPRSPVAAASATALSGAEVDTWQAVCNLLLCTLGQLDPPEVVSAARTALAAASASMHAGSDHQSILDHIFTSVITLHSRTYRIFQSIHQAILFPAIAHLHQNLYSNPAIGHMKDCRRPDGWTVLIYIGAAIHVTHQRWEQSLHSEHDPRHFQLRWELCLSFDKEMEQLRAVILRIQEIAFHAEATADYRRQVTDVLAGNGYIV